MVFAVLMLSNTARGTWLLNWSEKARNIDAKTKSEIGNLYKAGVGSFALGFAIWNLDNIFCETLTRWKLFVNWPAAFLLEGELPRRLVRFGLESYDCRISGHSWWHILTVSSIRSTFRLRKVVTDFSQGTGSYLMWMGTICKFLKLYFQLLSLIIRLLDLYLKLASFLATLSDFNFLSERCARRMTRRNILWDMGSGICLMS